ncbi:hypothetical protein IAT38_003109 [Cryptococcus sp. DSM 104549]
MGGPKTEDDVKVDARWNDVAADTVLISSDNVKFYVPSYYLLAHSEVFRNMAELAPSSPPSTDQETKPAPHTIYFTSPHESSQSLTFFLSLITGSSLDATLGLSPLEQVRAFHSALCFAGKYDCPMALGVMEGWLCELARMAGKHPQVKPLDIFVLAAKADMPVPASLVIKHYVLDGATSAQSPAPGWHWCTLPGSQDFYVESFSRKIWNEVPSDYLYALQSAKNTAQQQTTTGKYEEMAEIFLSIVQSKVN